VLVRARVCMQELAQARVQQKKQVLVPELAQGFPRAWEIRLAWVTQLAWEIRLAWVTQLAWETRQQAQVKAQLESAMEEGVRHMRLRASLEREQEREQE